LETRKLPALASARLDNRFSPLLRLPAANMLVGLNPVDILFFNALSEFF